MNSKTTADIPTQVKNPELVALRRRQIADASVELFVEHGFHKTTTRQIAAAAGLSIGALYEYVNSKEDVLYLVCNLIHQYVEEGVSRALSAHLDGRETLSKMIREYILVIHHMSDFVLLMYQETHMLPHQWQKKVLENEIRITRLFTDVLTRMIALETLPPLSQNSINLIAHNIMVLGHMWTFRRWYLARHFTIDEFIALQTGFILKLLD